jgi:hypothetical protein
MDATASASCLAALLSSGAVGIGLGCGSQVQQVAFGGGGPGGSGTGGTGAGGGTGATGGGSSGYTLDNVCDLLPTEVCARREACCTQSGTGFDQAGCEARERTDCEANVAEVNGGTMGFDPGKIDPCLDGMQPYLDLCALTFADRLAMFADLRICQEIWVGEVPPDGACERDAQCALPPDAEDLVGCDEATGRCTLIDVLLLGDDCQIGQGAARSFCAAGLYCDAQLSGQPPFDGTCQTATALDAPCDAMSQPPSLECGLGFLCDPGTGTCQEAGAPGDPCTRPFECQSLQCQGQQCGELAVIVDAQACTGSP